MECLAGMKLPVEARVRRSGATTALSYYKEYPGNIGRPLGRRTVFLKDKPKPNYDLKAILNLA